MSSAGELQSISSAIKFQCSGDSERFFWIEGSLQSIHGWSRTVVKYYMIYYFLYISVKLWYCKEHLMEGSLVAKLRCWASSVPSMLPSVAQSCARPYFCPSHSRAPLPGGFLDLRLPLAHAELCLQVWPLPSFFKSGVPR